MVFSSNWQCGATKWQGLNSGKMRVRNSASRFSNFGRSITKGTAEKEQVTTLQQPVVEEMVEEFSAVAISGNPKKTLKLFITAMPGHIVETRTAIADM